MALDFTIITDVRQRGLRIADARLGVRGAPGPLRDCALERKRDAHPSDVLQENNILRVRAAEMTAGNIDDFVMDNVVVVFKTGRSSVVDPGSMVAAAKPRKKKRVAKRAKKRR